MTISCTGNSFIKSEMLCFLSLEFTYSIVNPMCFYVPIPTSSGQVVV